MNEEVGEMNQVSIDLSTDPDEWDSFVERHSGPAYALWGWGDAVETYGHERLYLIGRARNEVVGVLPLFHMDSIVMGSKLVSPPYAARGSIVRSSDRLENTDVTKKLLERTRSLADQLGVDFVSLRGADLGPVDGFEKRNRFVTFRIPLEEETQHVRNRIKDSRRRQIDQAADSSLEYRVGTSIEDLRAYYRLHLESMRGHGTPPHSFRFFRELWNALYDDGRMHLGLIEKDGSPINGIIDFSLGSTVYQWGVVNDYEYRGLNGGSLLLWKSLERACTEGYDTYEMGRTREGSGVYLFKKSFGGEKTWYDDYHYFPNRVESLPNPEDEKYELVKRAWRVLPIPVTRVVGPYLRKEVSL